MATGQLNFAGVLRYLLPGLVCVLRYLLPGLVWPYLVFTKDCAPLANEPVTFDADDYHCMKQYDVALFTYRRWKDILAREDSPS